MNVNDKDPDRYNFLKANRDSSKKIEVKDLETGENRTHSSMYNCAKALKVNPGTVRFCNKRLYADNFEMVCKY